MALLWQNIRYGLRLFIRSPAFAAVTILSLALGIGANTAIFSVLDAVLLRELPVPQPRQLVQLSVVYRNGGEVPFSYPMFQGLDRWQRVFSGLYGWSGASLSNVEADGQLFLSAVRAVTGNYFAGLGGTPQLGRLIAPADVDHGTPVAVLGYECWESRFGRDPAVIGRTIRIEGKPFTVVGVTRQWFTGMRPGEPAAFTIPITASQFDRESRSLLWVFATGRLRDGVTIGQARTQLATFWPDVLHATVPLESRGQRRLSFFSMRLNLKDAAAGANNGLRDRVSRPLYLLMGAVVLILLIACVNLANLTLARAAARSSEMNTRAALGASRRQIVLQLLTESLLLSAIGTLLALALAHWGSPMLVRLITEGTAAPVILDLRPDWRVFAFASLAAILTGALIGLVPAWQMSRQEPALMLRQRGAGRSLGRTGKDPDRGADCVIAGPAIRRRTAAAHFRKPAGIRSRLSEDRRAGSKPAAPARRFPTPGHQQLPPAGYRAGATVAGSVLSRVLGLARAGGASLERDCLACRDGRLPNECHGRARIRFAGLL